MKKNGIILFLSAVCCLTACAETENPQSVPDTKSNRESEDNSLSAPASDDETPEPAPEDTFSEETWTAAYINYLNLLDGRDQLTYSLIYVDEDDVPELVADTGYEAGGCQILTWHEGKTDVLQTSRLYFNYIERGNLLCNSDGNMGYYYDDIYAIRDGKWEYLAGGTLEEMLFGEGGPVLDDDGEYVYEYTWNGEDVDKAAYQERLNAVYPVSPENPAKEPERYYILDELLSLLETGEVSSAGHRYELVTEDLTWTQAQAAWEEKGGYLAAITSMEEWERITEQIDAEGKNDIIFWVGAKDIRILEPGVEGGYDMLGLYNALFGFWMNGEPSYRGLTEDGTEVEERYVVLLYSRSEGRHCLNDVPNDILSAAPSYAGKVGYICEYNN